MKIQPIEFAIIYDSEPAFKPHRDSRGVEIRNRAIVVTPGKSRGLRHAWVTFKIIDNYRNYQGMVFPCDLTPFVWMWKRDSISFQADDFPKHRDVIRNLASGDLRGKIAEDSAQALFWHLYAFTPAVKKFLPYVYKDLVKIRRSMA